MQLRRVRGPVLDTLYARLRRCREVACTGRPFIEHSSFPVLAIDTSDPRPSWRQIADTVGEAIDVGDLTTGDVLPSVRELAAQHGVRVATLQRALQALAQGGGISVRQGRRPVVAVTASKQQHESGSKRRKPSRHDCSRAGCRRHQCRPMQPKTIRNIHSILSGAFAAAVRWEWIERNPADSAKLPKARPRRPSSPTPGDIAKVLAAARETDEAIAVYLWLASITGARRGELCALQWDDIDLDSGVIHIAWSYVVRDGQRLRKDTKTHQDRHLAIDPVTCASLREYRQGVEDVLKGSGVRLRGAGYVFSNGN